jgi:hypothetical protein
MRAAILALLVEACTVPPDIVAQALGAPTDASAPVVDATPQFDAALQDGGCASSDLLLWMPSGVLARQSTDDSQPVSLGAPSCLASGLVSAALDRSGLTWAQAGDGSSWWVRPDSLDCEPIGWALRPSTLSFVYEPQERLFAIEEGQLFELDTRTLEARAIGAIAPNAMLASEGAELFALTQVDKGTLVIERVISGDGGVESPRKVSTPRGFRAATYWRGELTVLLDSELVRYGAEDVEPQTLLELEVDAGAFAGLIAASCGAAK